MATGTKGGAARVTQLQVVHTIAAKIVVGQSGKDVVVGVIPANSVITNIHLAIGVLFNDSGTDLLNVGITANGTDFFSGQTLATAGMIGATLTTNVVGIVAADTTIYARYTGQNADGTTGSMFVIVTYVPHLN